MDVCIALIPYTPHVELVQCVNIPLVWRYDILASPFVAHLFAWEVSDDVVTECIVRCEHLEDLDVICADANWPQLNPNLIHRLVKSWPESERGAKLVKEKVMRLWRGGGRGLHDFENDFFKLERVFIHQRWMGGKRYEEVVDPFLSRVRRRDLLFRIPLPPHLLLAMCEFL